MKRVLIAGAMVLGLAASMPALADQCSDSVEMMNIEDLTTKNSMISLCREKQKGKNAVGDVKKILSDPEEVEKIKQIMTHVADTISQLADKFAVGVNDFVKTPVGFGMAVMTFAYFAGSTVMSVAIGIPLLLLFLWAWYKGMRMALYENVQIGDGPVKTTWLWGFRTTEKLKYQMVLRDNISGDRFGAICILIAAGVGGCCLILTTMVL